MCRNALEIWEIHTDIYLENPKRIQMHEVLKKDWLIL
jgi:hypothetical protein